MIVPMGRPGTNSNRSFKDTTMGVFWDIKGGYLVEGIAFSLQTTCMMIQQLVLASIGNMYCHSLSTPVCCSPSASRLLKGNKKINLAKQAGMQRDVILLFTTGKKMCSLVPKLKVLRTLYFQVLTVGALLYNTVYHESSALLKKMQQVLFPTQHIKQKQLQYGLSRSTLLLPK